MPFVVPEAPREKVDWESFMVAGPEPDPRLAVITSFYNPCGYAKPLENWHLFARYLAIQGVPLYTIELSFDGIYQLPEGERMKRVRTSSVLWHKERLLNLLAAELPPYVRYVAWVDCDTFFASPDWHRLAIEELQRYPVIQLFKEYAHTLRDDTIEFTRAGAVSVRNVGSAPGLAWAARRELFTRHGGLYDRLITGGGDCVAAAAFLADLRAPFLHRQGKVTAHAQPWIRHIAAWTRGRVGYIPTAAYHRWHGDRAHRSYIERERLLADYDPATDLRANPDGCYEWATDKPELHQGFRAYFASRREDG